jgi:hypothetical protein
MNLCSEHPEIALLVPGKVFFNSGLIQMVENERTAG